MTAYDDLILDADPLFYWPLDDLAGTVANDLSGNGLHGTYRGSPTLGVPGPRSCYDPTDLAAFFDGNGSNATADYVHRATSPISGTMDFTLEVWIQPATDAFTRPGRRFMNLIQQRPPAAGGADYAMMLRVFTNIDEALGNPTGFGLQVHTDDPNLVTSLEFLFARAGCWNHIAVTRSGDDFSLFLNASRVGDVESPGPITGDNLSFGGDHSDVNRIGAEEQELFRGRMAKAAGYARALSPAELAERYNMACTGCGAGWHVGTIGFGGNF
jgi:hypothetical protein